jgi:peptidoglycan lytic transglycosylase G
LPIKTPEQLVTLASIVEKETGKPEERTRVAAVFVNRLRQRMKLQSDPTIIYGLVGGKGSLGRSIMRSEIEQPTPYNTYVIDGLPPGPIANPGRASLEAAANPARTKELYFVADGTGGHAFADSYEQHQKNVARLRVLEQQTAQPRTVQPTAPAFAPTQPTVGTPRRVR